MVDVQNQHRSTISGITQRGVTERKKCEVTPVLNRLQKGAFLLRDTSSEKFLLFMMFGINAIVTEHNIQEYYVDFFETIYGFFMSIVLGVIECVSCSKTELKAVYELERVKNECEARIKNAEDDVRKMAGHKEEIEEEQREKVEEAQRITPQKIAELEKNTAVTMQDDGLMEQLHRREIKLQYYMDKVFYQVVMAITDMMQEEVNIMNPKMEKCAQDWAENYEKYQNEIDE